jgi:hypothetical protein
MAFHSEIYRKSDHADDSEADRNDGKSGAAIASLWLGLDARLEHSKFAARPKPRPAVFCRVDCAGAGIGGMLDTRQPAGVMTFVVFTVGDHHDNHDGQHVRPAHVRQLRLAQQCAL